MNSFGAQRVWTPLHDKITGVREGFLVNLPDIIAACIIVAVFYLLGRLLEVAVEKSIGRTDAPRSLRTLLGQTAKGVVVVIGVVIALGVLGLQKTVTTALAGAGIIGIVLGFALQDVVANFASGIVLIFRKPFREGDLVQVKENFGVVQRIDLSVTKIQTRSGQMMYVPNKDVFGSDVENFSELGRRRVDIECGVSYGDDLDNARKVAQQAIESLDFVVEDEPVHVFYREFSDHSVNFILQFWIEFNNQQDFLRAQSEAIQAIKGAFAEHGITIPFPIRTLDFNAKGGTTLSDELSNE